MDSLWDTKRCAAFLGYSYDYFRKEVMHWEGVPQPVDKPGRARWRGEDWAEWSKNYRNNPAKEEATA